VLNEVGVIIAISNESFLMLRAVDAGGIFPGPR
jgi:hypothetical protein